MKEITSAEEMLDNAFWMEDSMAKGIIIQAFKDYASQFIDKAADLADSTLLNETQVVEEIYKLKDELK